MQTEQSAALADCTNQFRHPRQRHVAAPWRQTNVEHFHPESDFAGTGQRSFHCEGPESVEKDVFMDANIAIAQAIGVCVSGSCRSRLRLWTTS